MILSVQAQPGARSEGLVEIRDGRLRVKTRAAPEAGKANAAIEKLVANALARSRSAVRVVSGASSRRKELVLEGIDLAEARSRLEGALAG